MPSSFLRTKVHQESILRLRYYQFCLGGLAYISTVLFSSRSSTVPQPSSLEVTEPGVVASVLTWIIGLLKTFNKSHMLCSLILAGSWL